MNDRSRTFENPEHRLRDGQTGLQSETGPADDNVVDLLGRLTRQGAHLAEEQVSLIKAELRESRAEVTRSVGAMAGAAVVGIAGLGVTLMGLAYLLGDLIDNTWLGTLLVGVATLAIAAVMYSSGKSKLDSAHLAPDRSIRTLEDTPGAVTGHTNTTHRRH